MVAMMPTMSMLRSASSATVTSSVSAEYEGAEARQVALCSMEAGIERQGILAATHGQERGVRKAAACKRSS
eukprot:1156244-Pelagomonas_calceolata.AAC.6